MWGCHWVGQWRQVQKRGLGKTMKAEKQDGWGNQDLKEPGGWSMPEVRRASVARY